MKFTPSEKTKLMDKGKDIIYVEDFENKGCGNQFYIKGQKYYCNKGCPSCSNNSSQSVQVGTKLPPENHHSHLNCDKDPELHYKNHLRGVEDQTGSDFKLSDKIIQGDLYRLRKLFVEDVKEFIKREWYLIQELLRKDIDEITFWKRRRKLAGDLK